VTDAPPVNIALAVAYESTGPSKLKPTGPVATIAETVSCICNARESASRFIQSKAVDVVHVAVVQAAAADPADGVPSEAAKFNPFSERRFKVPLIEIGAFGADDVSAGESKEKVLMVAVPTFAAMVTIAKPGTMALSVPMPGSAWYAFVVHR
jgi:hypothetical protein